MLFIHFVDVVDSYRSFSSSCAQCCSGGRSVRPNGSLHWSLDAGATLQRWHPRCLQGGERPRRHLRQEPHGDLVVMTGSWNGDDNRNHWKAKGYNPNSLLTMQATPHPLSTTSQAAVRYREAMHKYEGVVDGQFDYFSFEGYLAGRFTIEVMKRTYELTRQGMLDAVYGTRLFQIEEFMVGPFSRDCLYATPHSKGRSSYCNCSQGLRYLASSVLNKDYEFVQTFAGTYDSNECYNTPDDVTPPLLLGVPRALREFDSNAFQQGFSHIRKSAPGLLPIPFPIDNFMDKATTDPLRNETYLIAALGLTQSEPQSDFIVFSGLTASTVHAGQLGGVMPFRRERIFVLPTLQQELYSLASLVRAMPSLSGGVHLLVRSSSVPFGVDYYVGLVRASLRSHGYVGALSTGTFSDASSLSSAIPATSSSAPLPSTLVLVVGLGGGSELRAVSERVS
eukprot:PhM_4_TR18763/c1_g1_i4/m.4296